MPVSVVAAVVGAAVAQAAKGALLGAVLGSLASAAVGTVMSKVRKPKKIPLGPITITTKTSNAPREVVYGRVRKGGIMTFMEVWDSNKALNCIVTYAGHEIDSYITHYFNDEALTTDIDGFVEGRYAGAVPWTGYIGSYAVIEMKYGAAGESAFNYMVAESASKWTINHKQEGCASAHYKLGWNPDLYGSGVPNFSALLKGRKVYDPRTTLTVWSDNVALCVADYLTNSDFGMGYSWGEINEAALIAAANICDESVSLDAGGTESRYTCNGAFTVDVTPEEILENLLTAMAGDAVFVSGQWYIYAGAYGTVHSDAIDESMIVSSIRTTTRASRRDIFNGVKGQFVSEDTKWQTTDYPPYASTTYYEEDGDERVWDDLDLPFTKSGSMCQRIAKIHLERARRQIEVSMTCNLSAYKYVPGDIVPLTFERYGWSGKTFLVEKTGLRFSAEQIVVDLQLKEIDSNVFAWTTAEEQALPAASTTNLPDPFTTEAPGTPSFTETLYETTGSAGVKTRLTIEWADSDDGFSAAGGQYQLEYSTDNVTWVTFPNIRATKYELNDFQSGMFYFRLKAISVNGISSSYATATYTIQGLGAIPSNVNSFSVRPSNGFAHISWALHADLDVRIGGDIEVRHTAVGSGGGAAWIDTTLIDRFDGAQVVGVGPLIEGWYVAKARDSSGNYSSGTAMFSATEALVTGLATYFTNSQAAEFPGSKVNLSVSASILQLTNVASLTGTYYFPHSGGFYVDCGSKRARRFEADIALTRFDSGDMIDSRGLVDTWASVDGGGADKGDVWMYIQTTSTHPGSSTSVWTSWTPFHVADFDCRGARFKLEYETPLPTINLGVTNLTVHIKAP